jgi:hypothetical protein
VTDLAPTIKRLTGLLEELDADARDAPLSSLIKFTTEAQHVLREAELAWSDLIPLLRVGAVRAEKLGRHFGRWPPATWNGVDGPARYPLGQFPPFDWVQIDDFAGLRRWGALHRKGEILMVNELPGSRPSFIASAGGYPLRGAADRLRLFRNPLTAAEALEKDLDTHAAALLPTG